MATTDVDAATTETDDAPTVDDRDPATLIPAAVEEILELAATWLAWDGAPVLSDGNAWTPHKALRRITDHLLDHLAEIEATLAGQPTVPAETAVCVTLSAVSNTGGALVARYTPKPGMPTS